MGDPDIPVLDGGDDAASNGAAGVELAGEVPERRPACGQDGGDRGEQAFYLHERDGMPSDKQGDVAVPNLLVEYQGSEHYTSRVFRRAGD